MRAAHCQQHFLEAFFSPLPSFLPCSTSSSSAHYRVRNRFFWTYPVLFNLPNVLLLPLPPLSTRTIGPVWCHFHLRPPNTHAESRRPPTLISEEEANGVIKGAPPKRHREIDVLGELQQGRPTRIYLKALKANKNRRASVFGVSSAKTLGARELPVGNKTLGFMEPIFAPVPPFRGATTFPAGSFVGNRVPGKKTLSSKKQFLPRQRPVKTSALHLNRRFSLACLLQPAHTCNWLQFLDIEEARSRRRRRRRIVHRICDNPPLQNNGTLRAHTVPLHHRHQ